MSTTRYTFRDWALGLAVFVAVGLVAAPIGFTILKATAPYGWNRTIVLACPVFFALNLFLARRRQRA